MLTACMALIDEPSEKTKFLGIYNTYREMMFKVAMSVLHNEALAYETIQDCFFKIAANISDMPDPETKRAKALMIIMVRNRSLNNLKSEHYDKTCPINENEIISDDLLREVLSEIGYDLIVREISNLQDIYKDILTLRLLYGYSIEKICELLSISKRTAESRIYRGRKILRERLEEIYNEQPQI